MEKLKIVKPVMTALDSDALSEMLDQEVPDSYVVIAKHDVLGFPTDQIAEILGVDSSDVAEVQDDSHYKAVRAIISLKQSEQDIGLTHGWDDVESIAVNKLLQRLPYENDSDMLLRTAAVANKAARKKENPNRVLDPRESNGQTAITLTQRLVTSMSNRGETKTIEERKISIKDGSMSRPDFSQVNDMLHVQNKVARDPVTEKRLNDSLVRAEDFDEAMKARE